MVYEKNIVKNKISEKEKVFFDSYWNHYKKLCLTLETIKNYFKLKIFFKYI